MKSCYLCGVILESNVDSNTKNHYEHIIPQALGGQLKTSGILCKTCGGEKFLGGKVDKPFTDIFKLITERIDIKKDRNTNSVSLQGKLHLLGTQECIDVRIKDNIISNKTPDYKIDYGKKVIYVLANEKIAKSYRLKVEKDLKEIITDYADYKIEIVSSLNNFLGILELPFNIDNEIFEKGLTKIAIEFALSNGIDFNSIEHLVDRNNRTIHNKNIFPYYPITRLEEMIEYIRTSLDSNFMSHSLVLFSQKQVDDNGNVTKQLYCFIELFGTFQYFVELSDNYKGEDIEPISYAQKIIKQMDSGFEIAGSDYKDLFIIRQELGIEIKDLEGLSYDEICAKLQSVYDKKNKYRFDYSNNIESLVANMIRNEILKQNKNFIDVISDLAPHFYWNLEDEDFHITFFRSRFMRNGDPYSIIPEIKKMYFEDKDKFTRYTYFKFKELGDFIEKNKIA